MKPCPSCHQRISLRRVINGLDRKKFACTNCHTVLHVTFPWSSWLIAVVAIVGVGLLFGDRWVVGIASAVVSIVFVIGLALVARVEMLTDEQKLIAEETQWAERTTPIAVRVVGALLLYGGVATALGDTPQPSFEWMKSAQLIVGFLWALAGMGVLMLKEWGRKGAIIAASASIAVLLGLLGEAGRLHTQIAGDEVLGTDPKVSSAMGMYWVAIFIGAAMWLAVAVACIWVFNHPKVRAQFRK